VTQPAPDPPTTAQDTRAQDELWLLVKEVRQRKGPRQRTYVIDFGSAVVTVTIRRTSP
jgi:hypothetical protein